MAFGFGFIFGPVLGALSAGWFGVAGPGWVAAGICGFNLILAFFILGESRKSESDPAPAFAEIRADDARLETPTTWSLDQRFLFSHILLHLF